MDERRIDLINPAFPLEQLLHELARLLACWQPSRTQQCNG
jgi:hypothetical protein